MILGRAEEAFYAPIVCTTVDYDADFSPYHVVSSARSLQRRMRSGVTSLASTRPTSNCPASGGIPPPGFLLVSISRLSTVPTGSDRMGAKLLPHVSRRMASLLGVSVLAIG